MDANDQKNNKNNFLERVFIGLAIFAFSFTGGWFGGSASRKGTDFVSDSKRTVVTTESAKLIRGIAKDTGQSVVSVNTSTQTVSPEASYYRLFGFDVPTEESQGAGTGIILSEEGLIMTNRHVVPAGTSKVSVTLSDGTILDDVKVIGRTGNRDSLDVAFLKANTKGKKLPAAKIGNSSDMRVGDPVVAIGNTLGQFQNTVTSGIISGYGRSIQAGGSGSSVENLDDLFQTDAAINQGNSGGPLVNMSGEVIGLNVAIASGAQTVGFAIPINNIKGLIESIKATGKLERPYMGVRYVMLTDDIAEQLALPVKRGAYIPKQDGAVIEDGPAAQAGIEPGDVVTKIDNEDVDEKTSITSILGRHKVGETVSVELMRGTDKKTVQVELGATPSQ